MPLVPYWFIQRLMYARECKFGKISSMYLCLHVTLALSYFWIIEGPHSDTCLLMWTFHIIFLIITGLVSITVMHKYQYSLPCLFYICQDPLPKGLPGALYKCEMWGDKFWFDEWLDKYCPLAVWFSDRAKLWTKLTVCMWLCGFVLFIACAFFFYDGSSNEYISFDLLNF